MSYDLIKVEHKGRVGVITLNRPKQMNALNPELMQELGVALQAFDAHADTGAIVITGNEKAFAAGADIGVMKDYSYMDAFMADYITRDWEHIRRIRKPVIAAVSGYALPVAMMIKESINRAYESTLAEGILFERRVFHSQFALADQKEGMAAFLEKRKPGFKNR